VSSSSAANAFGVVQFLALSISALGVAAAGQNDWLPLREFASAEVRIVGPATIEISEGEVQRMVEAFKEQGPVPGLPRGVLDKKNITISLAAAPIAGLDGWSSPVQGLITLPLERVARWDDNGLYRAMRHELAHVALGVYMDYESTPVWVAEGFAEWVAGGLTCEGEARIRLDLLVHEAEGRPLLVDASRSQRSRLQYDYFTSFFEFLETWGDGVVSNGELLEAIREIGANEGIERTLGLSLRDVEARWWVYVRENYSGGLDDIKCNQR